MGRLPTLRATSPAQPLQAIILPMAGDGYVRWTNSPDAGALMFVTTTVLGYTPALRNPREKDHLLSLILESCRYHGAVLHAYCIMDHHVHLVLRAPQGMAMSKFMQSFKRHSALELRKSISPWILERLKKAGKDNRTLWMRSFRGIPIRTERVFWACIRYLHLNPIRAGICERIEEYPWSSARLFEECRWSVDEGIVPSLGKARTLGLAGRCPTTKQLWWEDIRSHELLRMP